MRVQHPRVEPWLAAYLRDQLAGAGFDAEIDNKEPTDWTPSGRALVIVRQASTVQQSSLTFGVDVAVSVLAGTRDNPYPAEDLAAVVYSIMTSDEVLFAEGSLLTAVARRDCYAPRPVPEDHDVARFYSTVRYSAVGSYE